VAGVAADSADLALVAVQGLGQEPAAGQPEQLAEAVAERLRLSFQPLGFGGPAQPPVDPGQP